MIKNFLYNLICFFVTAVIVIVSWEHFKFSSFDEPSQEILTWEVQIVDLGEVEGMAILDACERDYVERTAKEWDGFCHEEDGFELFLEPEDELFLEAKDNDEINV